MILDYGKNVYFYEAMLLNCYISYAINLQYSQRGSKPVVTQFNYRGSHRERYTIQYHRAFSFLEKKNILRQFTEIL